MKAGIITAALSLLWLAGTACADPARNDLSPLGRGYTELREGERNPFGQAVVVEEKTDIQGTESEEARLRRILTAVKVGGVSVNEKGRRVLLGTMVLHQGDVLPALIRGQQEVLRVSEIDRTRILISFVERDPSVEARQILIPLDVDPKVDQFLFGEAVEEITKDEKQAGTPQEAIPVPGVNAFLKGSGKANLLNVTDRKFEMMGEVSHESTDPNTR